MQSPLHFWAFFRRAIWLIWSKPLQVIELARLSPIQYSLWTATICLFIGTTLQAFTQMLMVEGALLALKHNPAQLESSLKWMMGQWSPQDLEKQLYLVQMHNQLVLLSAPIISYAYSYLLAGLLYLMTFGVTTASREEEFEDTLRLVALAQIPALLFALPFVGGLLGILGTLWVLLKGLFARYKRSSWLLGAFVVLCLLSLNSLLSSTFNLMAGALLGPGQAVVAVDSNSEPLNAKVGGKRLL